MGLKTGSSFNLKDKSPGPGQYNLDRSLSMKGCSIGSKGPSSVVKKSSEPGPGSYNLFASIDYLPMGKTFTRERRNGVGPAGSKDPGPGHYRDPRGGSASAAGPQYSFGTSGRSDLTGSAKKTPGPGQYNTRYIGPEGPKSFMTPRRSDTLNRTSSEVPGPGMY